MKFQNVKFLTLIALICGSSGFTPMSPPIRHTRVQMESSTSLEARRNEASKHDHMVASFAAALSTVAFIVTPANAFGPDIASKLGMGIQQTQVASSAPSAPSAIVKEIKPNVNVCRAPCGELRCPNSDGRTNQISMSARCLAELNCPSSD